jgi:hypothetical protein
VRVNVGGDPGRDDYGLPPIDVVIPDDARELDRDVQAYQRELRARRRRQRARRLRGPLTRDGMVLPLLAGCLILALVTSTLLIMFAADQTGMPSSSGPPPASSQPKHHRPTPVQSRPPAVGQTGGLLPATFIVIGGRHVPVREITSATPSVLALIPFACACEPALHQLRVQAAQARVALYLVGTGGDQKQVALLAAQAGQTPARVAEEVPNVLGSIYHQLGLTAILVRRGGTMYTVVRNISPSRGQNLAASLGQLATAGR